MVTRAPRRISDFREMKNKKLKITALTAYDHFLATVLDTSGIDMILVGDSLGNVFQGRETTIPVTRRDMIYHGEIVVRSAPNTFVSVDMPFLTLRSSVDDALKDAALIMQKTGCKAVKPEGGVHIAPIINRIVRTGIPVLGHVGLTPQSVNLFGGYGVQGKDNRQAIIDDAVAVQDAGAFAVVLEKIPSSLAEEITDRLEIPTIGIGAGSACDGQILVSNDMLGMFTAYKPSFVRLYGNIAEDASNSITNYIADVRSGQFPDESESYD